MASITKANIREFQSLILKWFAFNQRKFPWRAKNLTNYELIIAETLLQRTKAETVSALFRKFINEFPNWSSLFKAKKSKIEAVIKPIGLYRQRSKRLKNLAREMMTRKGRIPKNRGELEGIPFMGQYIANAVELIIFKRKLPLLDVNMSRVLERYFGEREMADIRFDPYLQSLSKKIVQHVKAKEINWAILDYAALVCKSRNPDCNNCIFKKKCLFPRITP